MISVNLKLDGGSHQTFLVINLLSIKVFILESLRLNSYDKNLLFEYKIFELIYFAKCFPELREKENK